MSLHRTLLKVCLLAVTFAAVPAFSAQRFYLDSPSTTLHPSFHGCLVLIREVPRQALLIAAEEQLGLDSVDPTVEPDILPAKDDLHIGMALTEHENFSGAKITLNDGNNKEIDTARIFMKPHDRVVQYVEYTEKIDALMQSRWESLLEKQSSGKLQPLKWDPSAPAPVAAVELLRTIDFQHAFLAARITHRAIAESGMSPARLGVLVRAYTNLGESTRHLINGQSPAFFARALLYAQRLVRLAPHDPASWQNRAYVAAILGLTKSAQNDMKHADELAKGKESPKWVGLTKDLLAFDTLKLHSVDQGDDAALARYFSWLTIEHSPLPTITINFARAVLEKNPGAVRVQRAITDNAGVGLLHQTTVEASLILNRLIAGLATDASADDPVRAAAKKAIDAQFSIPAISELLNSLSAQPREKGQLLPWSTYVAIVRDCQFANAVRRLSFVAHEYSVDPSDEVPQWMQIVGKHRYAVFIASFDRSGKFAGPDIVEKVRKINFKDDMMGADILNAHLLSLGIEQDLSRNRPWPTLHGMQANFTAYDYAQWIWQYRHGNTKQFSDIRDGYAVALLDGSPNNPIGIATELIGNWDKMKDRAEEINREQGNNPIIAYALGTGYLGAGDQDKAAVALEFAAKYAPDKPVFEQLAKLKLLKNDEEGWLKVWDQYLERSEDFGLDHASVSVEISNRLRSLGKYQEALPYAKAAADSYAAWGLNEYAAVLDGLHKYDEEAKVLQDEAERYDDANRFCRFCRATGRGNLQVAKKLYEKQIPGLEQKGDPNQLVDLGVYYYLEGHADRCSGLWERALGLKPDPFYSDLLAILRLEQKKVPEARQMLAGLSVFKPTSPRDAAYLTCLHELDRCLADENSVPARDGEIGKIIADPTLALQAANICYCLGRVSELREHKEDAKWWYRTALQRRANDFTCRALAATGLRRLGEEFYK